DSCFGDSGGPVYIDTAQGPALLGVVSRGVLAFGEPCAAGGVYVRADKVVSWIQSVSNRKVDRVPCELPADDGGMAEVEASSGCNAGGAVHGGLAGGFGALVIVGLRRRRREIT